MLMTTRSVAAAGLVALVATAAQAQNPGQDAFRPVVVVGCLTADAHDTLHLTQVRTASDDHRSTGSNSAKASTPVAFHASGPDRPRTSGMVTPNSRLNARLNAASES